MKQLLTAILLFIVVSVVAQSEKPGTGAMVDDQVFSTIPRLEEYQGAKTKREKWSHSLRKFSPIPGHQGKTNACVGWATGYSAMTIHKAIAAANTNKEDITLNAFSPFFIFNQVKKGNCSGALITDALELLKEKGDCLLTTFDEQYNCGAAPNSKALEEAINFKVKDYAALFYADDDKALKNEKTIQALLHDNPVIVVMQVTKSFRAIENGQKIWQPEDNEKAESSGHAMVVTGFDKRKKQFELMNSWGPNWGDQGYIWVSFDDFSKYALYGFQLLPDIWEYSTVPRMQADSKKQSFNISGNLFVLSDDPQTDIPFSVREAVVFDVQNNCYQLAVENWRVYDGFKLMAEDMTKGIYLYLFSINPEGGVEYLYPLPRDLNGDRLAHFIAGDSIEVTYPPGEEWLELDMPGTDSLIALFSWRAIDDVQIKTDQLTRVEGKLQERLTYVFGEQLFAPEDVKFELDKMAFSVPYSLEIKNKIIPLILLIEVEQ